MPIVLTIPGWGLSAGWSDYHGCWWLHIGRWLVIAPHCRNNPADRLGDTLGDSLGPRRGKY